MNNENEGLTRYLSPAGAWALALGTSVGWGSLVVTSNTYLAQAGPAGSVVGLVIAAVIMLVIARNYHYMIECFPDAGGAYTYSKEVLGHDHGFLTAWFLILTYIAMYWANVTSLPLFARYFIGNVFQFGFHYSFLGYELYFGEALLCMAAMLIFALFCMFGGKKIVQYAMIGLATVLFIGIAAGFAISAAKHDGSSFSFSPSIVPGKNAVTQVLNIACISPWAFIGFENISHSSEEFTFPRKKAFSVLAISIISATLVYILIILLSITAYPPEYRTWLDYINDIGNLSGIKALPAFYAIHHYFGSAGLAILMTALLALVFTSLIGNTIAISRLMYALARDNIIPERYSALNRRGTPARAIMLFTLISFSIPFLGRTAISWIVDVTTIGATIIYGFVSASAYKMADTRNERREKITGAAGLVIMIVFGVYLLLPNLSAAGTMAKESYILFTVWAVLGFLVFRGILKRDTKKLFGKSIIVWIALLSLILFTSLVWMNQSSMAATNHAITEVQQYYSGDGVYTDEEQFFISEKLDELRHANIRNMSFVIVLFALALSMLITNYRFMSKRAKESETELNNMRSTAYRDSLTGVKNKNAYAEKESDINEQIKLGLIDQFSVVVCDVNGLKHINDTFGHKAGDAYICASCKMICEIFKHSPVYRIGGDEFVVIMTGGDFEIRDQLMETLNKQVEENIALEKAVVSAGVSDYVKGADKNMHEVFERADGLMYKRKHELKAMGAKTRD